MRHARSIVFTRAGEPLQCVEREVPDPREDEFLVRVTHAGVCGSDVHRLQGDLPDPVEPVCFGHEGVGIVEALGAGITHDHGGTPLAVGDRVYWSPPTPCGACAPCLRRESAFFCDNRRWPVPAAEPNAASYQSLATVSRRAAFYRVPDSTSSDALIAFGCAMPTAIGGMNRLGSVAGANVVIQGCGPVGLAACVLCSIGGARSILVIGDPPQRLAIARRFGADETLSLGATTLHERRDRVMDRTGGRGADVVIEAAGRIEAFPEGMELLAVNGRYVIMGLYSGRATTPLDPVRINNRNLSIIGSLGTEMPGFGQAVEVAALHGERLGFAELVTHRFPLEQTQQAIDCVQRVAAIKAVVMPNGFDC